MSIGRVDHNTLKSVWSQAIHLIERLKRIRTAGAEMAKLRERLTQRALAARLEAERQRDPFQSPATSSTVTSTQPITTVKPVASVAGTSFQQMVHATPDYPPTTSAIDMASIASRLSQIFTAPETSTTTTANQSVSEPRNEIATVTTIGQIAQTEGATGLTTAAPASTTTEYREGHDRRTSPANHLRNGHYHTDSCSHSSRPPSDQSHIHHPANVDGHQSVYATRHNPGIYVITGHAISVAHVVSLHSIEPGSHHGRYSHIYGPDVSTDKYAFKLVAIPGAMADSQRFRNPNPRTDP